MNSFQMFAQQVIGGLAIGSMYALIALGFTLIYSGMRVVNWAQGEFFMVGAYVGLTAYVSWKWPFFLAFLFSAAVMFVAGLITERVAIKPVRRAIDLTLLMITIGISIVVKQLAILIWSPIGASFPSVFGDAPYEFLGLYVVPEDVCVFLIGILLMLVLYLLLFKTKLGMGMRAVAQSRDTAAIMGVNIERIDLLTFGVAIALAAAAGVIMAPLAYVEPAMGASVGIKGFVASVLGGFGNLFGAIFGGLFLGLAETIGAYFISSGYKDAIAFSILIIVLAFKPTGLFYRKSQR
ncbi:MAG: branched-chain amino acid ABC transporter permease [Peptococcaceae bacterium]|nr:branched-chain amino acid ABC transporter permease [Peptococcaceae bacterium]MDH7524827.1 branched-chain amino acid ABC transporter permease [Peptococcaceae bacterium]